MQDPAKDSSTTITSQARLTEVKTNLENLLQHVIPVFPAVYCIFIIETQQRLSLSGIANYKLVFFL